MNLLDFIAGPLLYMLQIVLGIIGLLLVIPAAMLVTLFAILLTLLACGSVLAVLSLPIWLVIGLFKLLFDKSIWER